MVVTLYYNATKSLCILASIKPCRCESCVGVVFVHPSAPCPECGLSLRKNQFRLQQFDDSRVEIEVDIRKKILKECVFDPIKYNYNRAWNSDSITSYIHITGIRTCIKIL